MCRTNHDPNDYLKLALEILKNIDSIAVWWVRKKCKEAINYVKESRKKRPSSTIHSINYGRRKSFGFKSRQHNYRKLNGSYDHDVTGHKSNLKQKNSRNSKAQKTMQPDEVANSNPGYSRQGDSERAVNKGNEVKSLTIDLYSEKRKGSGEKRVTRKTPIKRPALKSNLKNYYNVSSKRSSGAKAGEKSSKMKNDIQKYMAREKERIQEMDHVRSQVQPVKKSEPAIQSEDEEDLEISERPNEEIPVPHFMEVNRSKITTEPDEGVNKSKQIDKSKSYYDMDESTIAHQSLRKDLVADNLTQGPDSIPVTPDIVKSKKALSK